MLFTIQFKQKGSEWANDLNFKPSADRQSLAKQVQELAKANHGIAFRVHTPAKTKS